MSSVNPKEGFKLHSQRITRPGNQLLHSRIGKHILVTFDWISFVPTWTTLAADWAADAATNERRPNPWRRCYGKQLNIHMTKVSWGLRAIMHQLLFNYNILAELKHMPTCISKPILLKQFKQVVLAFYKYVAGELSMFLYYPVNGMNKASSVIAMLRCSIGF